MAERGGEAPRSGRAELVMVCTSDFAGQVRGKGFPVGELAKRLKSGIGWTPTNIMITAFGPIADSPFGALDDLILLPDPATRTRVDFADGSPPEHFYLGDLLTLEARPWDCCPRGFLKAALAGLEGLGLRLVSAFEHELYYAGALERLGASYNLDSIRRQGSFAASFLGALAAAGIACDSFLPEYGPRQYEVTYAPPVGLAAADQAVVLRELARAAARRLDGHVSFAPMVRLDGGVGNGVHVHMSLTDLEGRPVTYDPDSPTGLSARAGSFVAGILRHLPALTAITAPSVVSYLRLVPHKWSAAYANLGVRDREAAVRVCPLNPFSDSPRERQFNFEYRAADAAASPYLLLGALVKAGIEGLRAGLPTPSDNRGVPGDLDDAAWAARGVQRLPQSLSAALDALEADETAKAWFPPALLDAYLRYKRYEAAMMAELDDEERCRRYAEAY